LFIRQFFAVYQWVEAGLNAGNSDAGKVIVRRLRSIFGSLVWSLPGDFLDGLRDPQRSLVEIDVTVDCGCRILYFF